MASAYEPHVAQPVLLHGGSRHTVNARNVIGSTALMGAAMYNTNPDVVKALINAGADVNAREQLAGASALMFAAGNNTNPDVVRGLIAAGADVNARNVIGYTALMYGAMHNTNPDVVKALINAGADVRARDEKGNRAIDLLEYREDKGTFYGTTSYWAMRDLLY